MAAAPSRRKTASGGLRLILHRRLSRWRLQGAGASRKMRPGYDRARRVPHLPQSQKLSPCQIAFLSDQLAARGMPTDHLGQVRFVSGLDSNANIFSRRAFNTGHVVTQGNTIYVPPGSFDTVANFRSRTGFEEVYHTSQFASEGSAFYPSYAANSIGGWLATGDGYNGNLYEVFAKRAASEMRAAAGSQMCQN